MYYIIFESRYVHVGYDVAETPSGVLISGGRTLAK